MKKSKIITTTVSSLSLFLIACGISVYVFLKGHEVGLYLAATFGALALASFILTIFAFFIPNSQDSELSSKTSFQSLLNQEEKQPLLVSISQQSDQTTKQILKTPLLPIELRGGSVIVIDYADVKLGKRVGVGGYSEVYEGDWHGSRVAVKKLFAFDILPKENALKEFFKEVTILTKLHHPHILTFYGASIDPFCMILELLRGSLYDAIHLTPKLLSWPLASKFATQIARAMLYLHSFKPNPILHRDLKSQNVLIDEHWEYIKLTDFGMSRAKELSTTRTSLGTVQWTAPEVLRGDTATIRSDVYSYGVILWELCTLRLPYDGKAPIVVASEVAYRNLRLATPKACPPEWLKVLNLCLRYEVDERPSFFELTQIVDGDFGHDWKGKYGYPLTLSRESTFVKADQGNLSNSNSQLSSSPTLEHSHSSKVTIFSGWSTNTDTAQALAEAYNALITKFDGKTPNYLNLYATEHHSPATLTHLCREMKILEKASLHGVSTCGGVMTEDGYHHVGELGYGKGPAIAIMGIHDPAGLYIVVGGQGRDPYQLTDFLIKKALKEAADVGKRGVPRVFLTIPRPYEPAAIQAIEDNISKDCLIVGGTPGAEAYHKGNGFVIENGNFWTFEYRSPDSRNEKFESFAPNCCVSITLLWPSCYTYAVFDSGYFSTAHSGTVTTSLLNPYEIVEIDNKPAAEVYNQWCGNAFDSFFAEVAKGKTVEELWAQFTTQSLLYPLGIGLAADEDGDELNNVALPLGFSKRGGVYTAAFVAKGQKISLLASTRGGLLSRVGRAFKAGIPPKAKIAGCLLVNCATFVYVTDMEKLVSKYRNEVNNAPFVGGFSFAEQGHFSTGANLCGSMMFSAFIFCNLSDD